MTEHIDPSHSEETITDNTIKVQPPRMYKVVLHNDDYTPMDFVVDILIHIFRKDESAATQIMLNVHHKGKGICGAYPYEIAETKVEQVHELAEEHEYPLKASMEVE